MAKTLRALGEIDEPARMLESAVEAADRGIDGLEHVLPMLRRVLAQGMRPILATTISTKYIPTAMHLRCFWKRSYGKKPAVARNTLNG